MIKKLKVLKDKLITKIFSRFPVLAQMWAEGFDSVKNVDIPWTPFEKDLSECSVALVTTAGVHISGQLPFDMDDEEGDATFREISVDVKAEDLMITHKYYDHSDADRDINIVFPIDRLSELAASGLIKGLAPRHFGVMGHILGGKLTELIKETAPTIAGRLKEDGADIVLLTPG